MYLHQAQLVVDFFLITKLPFARLTQLPFEVVNRISFWVRSVIVALRSSKTTVLEDSAAFTM